MAITEDILVRLRVQGQQQFATAMGGAATQTGKLGTVAGTTGKSVDDTGKKAKSAGGKLRGLGSAIAGSAAAATAMYAAQKVVRDSIGNAVDLGEQINKTGVVFRGPGKKSILDWSKTTATGIGISQRAALEAAGVFGNMLVPMGLGRAEAAKMSKGMVNLAGDMASFNNATPEETLDAIRAGISGETEPLRRFGVRLSQARIEQEAMAMGLTKGKRPLDDHARALATQSLIMKDTKDAHGDFGRTSDSLANQQRILAAQYENVTAKIGQALLPVIKLLTDNMEIVLIVAGVLTAAVVALGIAMAIAWIAALSGPILIAAAVAALIAVLVALYVKFKIVRQIVAVLWEVLKHTPLGLLIRHFGTLRRVAVAVFNAVKGAAVAAFKWVKNAATDAFNWVKTAATNAVRWVKTAFNNVVGFIKGLPGKIASAAAGMWDGIKDAFRSAINWIINAWNGLEFKIPGFDPPGPGPKFGGVTIGVPDLPTLAAGGTATAGRAHLVGEQGPELFVPGQTGTVFPNGAPIHTHVYLNGREIATAVGSAVADRKARR